MHDRSIFVRFYVAIFVSRTKKEKKEPKKHASARRKNEMCGDGDDFPPAVDRIWNAVKMKIAVHCNFFFHSFRIIQPWHWPGETISKCNAHET